MSGQHENRKKLGYVLVALKESLNGYDTGAGLVKIPLWLAGITVSAVFAPWVLGIGIPIGILYAIRAIVDEKANHEKIDEKLKQLKKLEEKAYQTEMELNVFFNKAFVENQNLYPEIYAFGINNVSSKTLLKYLLRDYFEAIKNSKRQKNGHLHNQGKILNLIKEVSGHDKKDPDFLKKMSVYLEDEDLHTKLTQFYNSIPLEKYENKTPAQNDALPTNKGFFAKAKAFFAKHKKARGVIRRVIDFISDFGMGMGITASLMTLLGVISATNPVTLPLVAAIVISGLVYGGITLAYNLYVDKERKQAIKKLDDKIKNKNTNVSLAQRILKIQKRKAKGEFADLALDDQQHYAPEALHKTIPKINPSLPLGFKLRIAGTTLAQIISSVALGMAVGMGLVWIATLLFPVIPFVLPAIIVGVAFTAYYLTRTVKAQYKTTNAEIEKYKEIAILKHDLKAKVGEQNFNRMLLNDKGKKKDNRTLLKEVINDYIKYLDALDQNAIKTKSVKTQQSWEVETKEIISFKKQEKILTLIEQVSGVKRGDDINQFYNGVAKYLQGDVKDSYEANNIVQYLKNKLVPEQHLIAVNADKVNVKENFFKRVALKFGKDHLLPILGVVGLALVLPIFLIGPQAFVAVGLIGAVIIGAHIVSKVAQYKADKQGENMADKNNRMKLIERKIKIQNNIDELKPKVELVVEKKSQVKVAEKPNPEIVMHSKFKPARHSISGFWAGQKFTAESESSPVKKPADRKTVDLSQLFSQTKPKTLLSDELENYNQVNMVN